jgi:2,4-dienoyl-CoA reductase-like NADH-dependent reductase (Old Yellow Enzyme family)/thioredoxin reductase
MLQKKPTDPRFRRLFTPGYIGKLWVKNRIVRSPMLSGLATTDGCITERVVDHYKEFARGGAGLVIVEFSWVDNDASKAAMGQPGVSDKEHKPGLQWLASAIKGCGARACLQIVHCGRQKFLGRRPYKSAHRTPWPDIRLFEGAPVPDELTIEEIEQIIQDFGDAAARAKVVGFDMVEIHGAHGYLITNFLSPQNRRPDWYGGSLSNRMRFLLQVFTNCRRKVGPDFPVGVRLSGTDYESENPIPIEETIQVAQALEKLSCDVIDVSGGMHQQGDCETVPMYHPLAFNVWAAERIKKSLAIPVMATGSITSPELAENILEEGKGDFIGLGRPLLADPYFPIKAQKGRPEDIRPCIRCVECTDRGVTVGYITCTVNPTTGREGELTKITPANKKKKIAVIGGGPGGMEAAAVSALRGHDVTLYEKRELGGLLVDASLADIKADLRPLIKYYITQLDKNGVKVVKEEASSRTVRAGRFDAVVVATGAILAPFPKVSGIDRPSVINALEIFRGAKTGKSVVIVGGGLVGCEAALILGKEKKKVTITSRQTEVARGLPAEMKRGFRRLIADMDVAMVTEVRLEKITEEGVIVSNWNGEETSIKGDTVAVAAGFLSNLGLWNELSQVPELEVYAIGDCVAPRMAYDAIHEGFYTAFELL